jgi:hypothetical protein
MRRKSGIWPGRFRTRTSPWRRRLRGWGPTVDEFELRHRQSLFHARGTMDRRCHDERLAGRQMDDRDFYATGAMDLHLFGNTVPDVVTLEEPIHFF